jgi:hypothetical protein
MVNIKRFIDRVAVMDAKAGRDVVIPVAEARALRDEIAKLLADKLEEQAQRPPQQEVVEVVMNGGSW